MSGRLGIPRGAFFSPPIVSISLRHRFEYGIYRVLARVLGGFPRPTVQALGEGLGLLAYALDKRHRKVSLENLRRSDLGLTEAEARRIARASFRHFGAVLLSVVPMSEAAPEDLDTWILVDGLEHFDAAKAEGRGFIQITGHYGDWEAVALMQSRHGRSLTVIGRELDNPLLEPVLKAFRQRFGNRQIAKGGALRETMKALKAGDGVGFVQDQDALTSGVFVPFLGRWAATHAVAGTLAAKMDLPILPVFSWPRPDGRIQVRFLPPFHAPRTGDAARDAWEAARLMTRCVEDQVRKDPRFWFWMHNRFKTQPESPGAPPLPPPEWLDLVSTPTSN